MSRSIRLSKEFGVNPSITHCECCGKDYGIAMFGTGYKDKKTGKTAQAPKDIYYGFCNQCQGVIDQGGLLIVEVRDGESGDNPYRTGRIKGITKEAKERMFSDCKAPMCYMEESVFEPMFGEFCKKEEL